MTDEVNDQSGQTGLNGARARNRWAYRNPLLYPNKVLNNFKSSTLAAPVTLTYPSLTTLVSMVLGQGSWMVFGQMTALTSVAPGTGVVIGSVDISTNNEITVFASSSGGGYCSGTNFYYSVSVTGTVTIKSKATVFLEARNGNANVSIAQSLNQTGDVAATSLYAVRLS